MLSSLNVLSCTLANEPASSTSKLHPLCVEEVLAVLFQYFSFSELKKFRTVCRAWEKEARHALSTETRRWKLSPIILNKDWNLSKFLHVVGRQVLFFDFTKFHLVGIIYEPKKSTVKTSKFLRLLSICGHRITTLHLKVVAIKGKFANFVTFFNELQQFCPNLEKLVLKSFFAVKEGFTDLSQSQLIHWGNINLFEKLISLSVTAPIFSNHENFDQHGFDVYMRHLFKVTPNLEEFRYFDRTGKSLCHLDSIIASLQEENLTKLKSLHLDTGRGDIYDLKQMEMLGMLKLRSLKIGIDSFGLNPELANQSFSELLQTQRYTLTSLQVCFNILDMSHWTNFFTPTFTLQCLQELSIPYQNFTFGSLKFTPSLRKLVLRGNPKSSCWIEEATENSETMLSSAETSLTNCLKNWAVESKNTSMPNNIKHLRCEFIVDEATIRILSKKFTKVESLEFGYLSEDVLLHVYEHFKDVKHLAIVCPPAMYVSSRAYLGESKNIALTESRKAGFKLDIGSRNKVAEQIRSSTDPSILCLKGLQRLELIRFGSLTSMNRIHHSIECSSGFMFGISALQNVTELKLHPFIHKRAVMSLQLMPSLKVIWAVPLIIGSRETGGRSDFPTTAYWYQVLLRKRPDLKIYVTTAPTHAEQKNGIYGSATRLLKVTDLYRGNATSSGLFVYLDECYMYQDGCEVLKEEYQQRKDSSLQCSVS